MAELVVPPLVRTYSRRALSSDAGEEPHDQVRWITAANRRRLLGWRDHLGRSSEVISARTGLIPLCSNRALCHRLVCAYPSSSTHTRSGAPRETYVPNPVSVCAPNGYSRQTIYDYLRMNATHGADGFRPLLGTLGAVSAIHWIGRLRPQHRFDAEQMEEMDNFTYDRRADGAICHLSRNPVEPDTWARKRSLTQIETWEQIETESPSTSRNNGSHWSNPPTPHVWWQARAFTNPRAACC